MPGRSRSPSTGLVPAPAALSGEKAPIRFRTIILVSLVRFMVNLDRMAFSFFVVAMASELGWSAADQGRVKSAFSFGYMFTQIPGGIAGDHTGNKKFQTLSLLSFALGLGGIPSMVTAVGADASPRVVEWACFLVGLCCGAEHPTMTGLIKNWCLPAEKNWCVSMESVSTVGSSLANCLIVAYLTTAVGWRNTMYVLSAVTWLFLIVFQLMVSDGPTATGGRLTLSAQEAALYRAEGMLVEQKVAAAASPKKRAVCTTNAAGNDIGVGGGSVRALFTNKGTWVLILSHAMFNLGRYTYEQEMPKYYLESLGENNSGMHLATLHITAVSGSMLLKGHVDSFGLSVISIRRVASIGGYSLFAVGCGVLACLATNEELPPAYMFTVALNVLWLGLTVQSFGHVANYYDITRTNTGLLMGVGNSLGKQKIIHLPILPHHFVPLSVHISGCGTHKSGL